ncbi:MAG TPA: hypothetical protein PK970_08165, partial [Hyphomicrobiaceae bacterium]|nr:hypothetical protein [Hyphomicrobiaceae bacterium]
VGPRIRSDGAPRARPDGPRSFTDGPRARSGGDDTARSTPRVLEGKRGDDGARARRRGGDGDGSGARRGNRDGPVVTRHGRRGHWRWRGARRIWVPLPVFIAGNNYIYSYDECRELFVIARRTGSSYWWRKYRECRDYFD